MTDKKTSFEAQLNELEQIVANLENGTIPLEDALTQFQQGVKLSQTLEQKLSHAETTVAKLMDQDGKLKDLDVEDNQVD